MRIILAISFLLSAVAVRAQDRVLYFADPAKPEEYEPLKGATTFKDTGRLNPMGGSSAIDLWLIVRSLSSKDRNELAELVVDDYRLAESKQSKDKRVPNVSFEVTKEENGSFRPIGFRASSNAEAAEDEFLEIRVNFEFGGDPKKLEEERNKALLQKHEGADLQNSIARLKELQTQFAPNAPGTYRIRAFYRPKVDGKWTGELSTEPITVVIQEAK